MSGRARHQQRVQVEEINEEEEEADIDRRENEDHNAGPEGNAGHDQDRGQGNMVRNTVVVITFVIIALAVFYWISLIMEEALGNPGPTSRCPKHTAESRP